jgi:hypothetical protein
MVVYFLAEELKIVLPDKAIPPLYSKSADFLAVASFLKDIKRGKVDTTFLGVFYSETQTHL